MGRIPFFEVLLNDVKTINPLKVNVSKINVLSLRTQFQSEKKQNKTINVTGVF